MSLLRQPIERKLSAVIGAEVTFEKLKVSLIGGSIEASGVTIAGDDPSAPLLTVRRVRAEISVAKALAKQFVIKSLTIEGPAVLIVRTEDGSTNLPRRPIADLVEPPEPQEPISESETTAPTPEEPASWRLETQRVTLTDGQIHFRDRTEGSSYFAAAEQVNVELRQIEDKVTLTASTPTAGRRDREINIGPIQITATFTDITDLARLGKSPVEARVEIAGGITAEITSPAIADGKGTLKIHAPLNLAEWIAALPPLIRLPEALKSAGVSGRANLSLLLQHDPAIGLNIEEFVLRVSDATIPRPPAT